ncbi:MAG: GNAT family N-acetyltransferase [Gammaproteobacteria bacterium]|nr:GNAT family N-acetyltransferase [Gammaproteobacteria bacterium]
MYQTPAWMAFVAETQSAESVVAAIKSDGRTVGHFCGLIVRRMGIRILGSPFEGWTTSYMGLLLDESASRRHAMDALVRFAFRDLGCSHLEVLDRRLTLEEMDGGGYAHQVSQGFEVDLSPSEDDVFANFTRSCRWSVRKAERNGVIVEEASDIEFADEFCAQQAEVFAAQSLTPTYGIDRVRALIKHVCSTGMLLLLRARDGDGNCMATGIFPGFHQSFFFWGGASWKKYQRLLPNEAIQWYAIRYWKRRGIRFYDMVGGGEYKRKYGGREIRIPRFQKSKYPGLQRARLMAKKLIQLRRRCLVMLKPVGSRSGAGDGRSAPDGSRAG